MADTALRRLAAGMGMALAAASGNLLAQLPGECPQPRFTGKAPDEYYSRPNPLQPTPENLAAGGAVYRGDPRKISCASCHGETGDGKGPLAIQFDPPPRNFACAQTIKGIPEGHLFWIVRYGSPGTSMRRSARASNASAY